MDKIEVIAPITVANLGCGFDVLGLSTTSAAEEMIVSKNTQKKIRITNSKGYGNLPLNPEKNSASVAIQALLNELNSNQGFDIEINKLIKPGSGLGSSAASSAAAVVAANELLGNPFKKHDLIKFAMEGERVASGSAHADNVAPAIFGGITLVRTNKPVDVIKLPVPENLYCVLLHPQIEIKTKDARDILKKEVDLSLASKQWANVGALVAGLFTDNYELISRSLVDYIVEPQRKVLIKGYDELKKVAMSEGAMGFGISGSGPSVFAMCKRESFAQKVLNAMIECYSEFNIGFNTYLSKISNSGVTIK